MARRPDDLERLIDYAAGDLSPDEAAQVERRLTGDPAAAAFIAQYRQTQAIAEADDTVAPPADVLARAKAIFRHEPETRPTVIEQLRDVVATLLLDTRLDAAGVRDATTADAAQISYASPLLDIDLRIEPGADGKCSIIGQITSDQDPGPITIDVHRHGRDDTLLQTQPDERGFFELTLEPGSYDLMIRATAGTVSITELEVR